MFKHRWRVPVFYESYKIQALICAGTRYIFSPRWLLVGKPVCTTGFNSVNLKYDLMNYSLEKISTVEVCNTLLASAQKKRYTLARRRRNMGESIDRFIERNSSINTRLISVQVLLEAYTAAYNILAEGSRGRINMNVKIKRLEVRKARLDKMYVKYSAYLLLRKQVDYYRLDSQVLAIDTYIAAVQHKKIALSNSMPLYTVEQKPLKRRPSDNIQISTSFSNPVVVHAKQSSGKSAGSYGKHFSEVVCTTKSATQKKTYSF
jgi:hypothetical protein